jgi:hypothetical protein
LECDASSYGFRDPRWDILCTHCGKTRGEHYEGRCWHAQSAQCFEAAAKHYYYTPEFKEHLRNTLSKEVPAVFKEDGTIVYGGQSIDPKTAVLDSHDYRHFPEDAKERKTLPVFSGVIKYFPDAIIGVAAVSYKGNEQHNPGQPLHWSKEKSKDHEDALVRHLIESVPDTEAGLEAAFQTAWRALAVAQIKFERMRNGDNNR